MRRMSAIYLLTSIINLIPIQIYSAEERPIDIIEDNSFLIEEAYNQEPGVVQHIFAAAFNNDSRRRGWPLISLKNGRSSRRIISSHTPFPPIISSMVRTASTAAATFCSIIVTKLCMRVK